MVTAMPESQWDGHASAQPSGALALVLQEPFTIAIRLRSGRPVAADAASFRIQVKQLLAAADQEARRLRYEATYIRLAVYAFVAFLDESVLNSRQPIFADWQPLQEEVFLDHVAGETFFKHVDELLRQQDSSQLADVLEVYQFCMLLGFRGKYSAANADGLQATMHAVGDRIRRIRGPVGSLSPAWALPTGEVLPASRDALIPRLLAFAAGALVLAVAVFVAASLSLRTRTAELTELVEQLTRQ
jgi:type VI secretion system protein ImpK